MRLICPNCSAQYEVGDSVIPDAGRDVQCSSCGKTWFQQSRAMMDALAAQDLDPSPEEWEGAAQPAAAPSPNFSEDPPPNAFDINDLARARASGLERAMTRSQAIARGEPVQTAPKPHPSDDDIAASIVAELEAEAEPLAQDLAPQQTATVTVEAPISAPVEVAPESPPAPVGGPRKRRMDDSLLSILREEAQREAEARRAEGTLLETQEEMNLEPAMSAASRVQAKLAAAQPPEPETQTPAPSTVSVKPARLVPRPEPEVPSQNPRTRLPDIEEINSTLRASADRTGQAAAVDAPQVKAQRRSGFRLGFFSVIGLAVICVALYAAARPMAQTIPMLSVPFTAYANTVDALRLDLDRQLQNLILQLKDSRLQ
ncbi:hypothetical protein BFP70_16390 [Thioclava sp. SK-1]|uniref:zinc-ribbon domain-containing protein n=1 Tax=Thioclava sp. SK-1 TaxID=1889770 RepID=UPI000826CEFD|nr:zinc-ribbon domain-containing protein [Thioclava sp. SK-1]OCX61033.1 hypothetical protein BFP70_16390 [Thioclava sp. SK-1]